MSDLLKHRGYHGSVEYSAEDDCLYGVIIKTRFLIRGLEVIYRPDSRNNFCGR
jgi:hypothetical protein